MSEPELPEGEYRKPIRSNTLVRDYLKDRTAGSTTTISQYLMEEVLPANWQNNVYTNELAYVKVTDDVDEIIDHMAGDRVSKGDVLAYYILLDAIRKEELDEFPRLFEQVPPALWGELEREATDVSS